MPERMPYRDDVEALEHRCRALEAGSAALGDELAGARQLLAESLARRRLPVLDDLRVAAPCHAAWESMLGDERVRFCGRCEKNVYNLSALTRAETEALLVAREGKPCVRYHRRADGTVLTTDCPVGARRRRRRRRMVAAAFGAMSTVAAAGAAWFSRVSEKSSSPTVSAVAAMVAPPAKAVEPRERPPIAQGAVMGIPAPPREEPARVAHRHHGTRHGQPSP
jgi:hypothetical protein